MGKKKKTIHGCQSCAEETREHKTPLSARLASAGVWLIGIAALYQLIKLLGVFSFTPKTEGVLGLGTIFMIGIAASLSSCLALVGGLLLSISARFAETHQGEPSLHRFWPLASFNIGRVVGYAGFGALTGMLGATLSPSVQATGFLKAILALLMIVLGLQILHIVPKKYCRIPLPLSLRKHLQKMSESESFLGAFGVGALTYFIPCGYTQSVQLLALGSGSALQGALMMTFFALGTLPALLGISAASSLAHGKAGKIFFSFAGSLSLFLGIGSFTQGLALAGVDLQSIIPCCSASEVTADPNVTIDKNGQQVLSVSVLDTGYSMNTFSVQRGMSTWIYADVPSPLSGCISQMTVPVFNLSKPLAVGPNWIGPFTPTDNFEFMCSMGMFRARVNVQS